MLAAIKLVPLGQVAGQKLLLALMSLGLASARPATQLAAATQKSAHGPCFANRGANPRKGWREASNSSIASDETNQIIDEPSR